MILLFLVGSLYNVDHSICVVGALSPPVMMNSFSMPSFLGLNKMETSGALGKESTALDVLQELNRSNQLAPFVTQKDKEEGQGVAVVTGGNSGIGVSTVETLALTGMKVVLCCRNLEDGEKVVDSLTVNRENVRVQKLDLADLDSIEMAVDEIIEKEGRIDLLLNNAGVMAIPQKKLTSQNFEYQLGVNHIGHFFLTRKLLPYVNQGGRVVTVASTAHTFGQIDISNLNYDDTKGPRSYSPWGAYGQSKLANILFAKALQTKLEAIKDVDGESCDIISVCLHPGVIATNLWKQSTDNNPLAFLSPLISNVVADRSIDQGASTNVYTSLVDSSQLVGGGYYSDCTLTQPNSYAQDSKLANDLWDATEELILSSGYELPSIENYQQQGSTVE